MAAAGIKSRDVLDELESHLREDVEQKSRAGMDGKTAFENAVRGIGQPEALRREWAKAGTTNRNIKNMLLRFLGFPMLVSENFTASARETLELGRQEAMGFHHDFIGTEHVLLGLLDAETGVVPRVLEKMGVRRELVRAEIEKIVGAGSQCGNVQALPYTPRVKKSLDLAAREAKILKRPQIGAEHIFLGLVIEGSGVAGLVLKRLGVDAGKACGEIMKELSGQKDINE